MKLRLLFIGSRHIDIMCDNCKTAFEVREGKSIFCPKCGKNEMDMIEGKNIIAQEKLDIQNNMISLDKEIITNLKAELDSTWTEIYKLRAIEQSYTALIKKYLDKLDKDKP